MENIGNLLVGLSILSFFWYVLFLVISTIIIYTTIWILNFFFWKSDNKAQEFDIEQKNYINQKKKNYKMEGEYTSYKIE